MNIAVVYHMIPHYRSAVMRQLDKSTSNTFWFFGNDAAFDGVEPMPKEQLKRFVVAPFMCWRELYWQSASIAVALSPKFDAVIYLANPNFISTWLGAILARFTGKRVLFWTHGWLKGEALPKSAVRHAFYRLADQVLVYGERALELGVKSGFARDRITVVYNSLDSDLAWEVTKKIERGILSTPSPRSLFSNPSLPLLICTARLTKLCRFDILFDAATKLEERGRPVNILLVGEGPEREALRASAKQKRLNVHFFGACYDEEILGRLIYDADLTVSPGKIGLTAIHSLMYGTPAVTHSDLDAQMPEVEALVEGVTGSLFERDNADSLVKVIETWLSSERDRAKVRADCRAIIGSKWNPSEQSRIIEAVVSAMRPAPAEKTCQ